MILKNRITEAREKEYLEQNEPWEQALKMDKDDLSSKWSSLVMLEKDSRVHKFSNSFWWQPILIDNVCFLAN